MIGADVISLIFPLVLTGTIEALGLYFLSVRKLHIHFAVLLVNCVTNPVLTVMNGIFQFSLPLLIVAEGIVILIEYFMLRYVLNLRSMKWFTVVFVINTASFIAGLLFFAAAHPAFLLMVRCRFAGHSEVCVEKEIADTVSRKPERSQVLLDDIYHLWPVIYIGIDRRSLSDAAHTAGMMLGDKYQTIADALPYCSRYWFSGCVHGVVMEHAGQRGTSEGMMNMCSHIPADSVSDCLHGIGHALWIYRTQDNLSPVLQQCSKWTDVNFSSCVSGVLMEYSIGDSHQHGDHSNRRVYSRALPCESLDPLFQPTCYAASASYMTYYPGTSFADAEEYCRNIPFQYHDSCLLEIARRRILSGL